MKARHARLNIYLDPPELRDVVRSVALKQGQTASGWCVEAIVRRLREEGAVLPAQSEAREAASNLDRIRESVGRIGVPVRELIDDGRRR